ncbi:MAG: YggS family pyridoxal phosphate-dependent enzyme [Caldilineales bacterium]|nr:YggS family pyridoxal phosphate-dependent enzyme [Caldilineales bacterium]
MTLPPIAENLERVRERIADAAMRASRDPDGITLVAVSKTHPWDYVSAAIAAGQRDFGENRPEEALEKIESGIRISERDNLQPPTFNLHLIGPIQSRKAAIAYACNPAMIHSIDRLKIARKLNDLAVADGQVLHVLLEVNVSGEASKAGFGPDELRRTLPELLDLPALRVHGLMTIPPFDPDPGTARPHFIALRRLRDELALAYPHTDWSHLSMGMSDDFEIAIAEGATHVRVGSAIFGPRA